MKLPKQEKSELGSLSPAPLEGGAQSKGEATFEDNRLATHQLKKVRTSLENPPSEEGTVQLRQRMQGGTGSAASVGQQAKGTGLPAQLKSGVENLSGFAMDDVKVHYNSSKPAQLRAHAYAQGTDIHVGPGQEKHLAHEAWHVVQQKQGRVKPTRQLKSKVNINDDAGLEKEADVMGARAWSGGSQIEGKPLAENHVDGDTAQLAAQSTVIQCDFGDELERELQEFVEEVDALIKRHERRYTNEFRLINLDTLLVEARPKVREFFVSFIAGEDGSKYGHIMDELMFNELKKLFGYEDVARLKAQLLNPLGWGNLTFETKGVSDVGLKAIKEGNAILYNEMLAKYGGNARGEEFLDGVIKSGAFIPEKRVVKQGTTFYKLMPPGGDFMASPSPYYLSWAEMQDLLKGTNMADHLGLPLINYEAVYCVYEIQATGDTTVFESTIAPTRQRINNTGRQVSNVGGRRQTLILDSQDTDVWTKRTTPKYMLDPDEVELLALAGYLNQDNN